MADAVEEALERLGTGPDALRAWLRDRDLDELRRDLDAARDALPVPIGPFADSPIVRRRRALDRLHAYIEELDGDIDALVAAERVHWLRGGPHVDYLRVLRKAGRVGEAASLARTLLERADQDGEMDLAEFLAEVSQVPDGWEEAVAYFVYRPTPRGWDELFRFTPPEVVGERKRYTLYLMIRLGADPTFVFLLASRDGVTSEATLLAEQGLVEPFAIEKRAEEMGAERGGFLGLAARAACVKGDRLGTVRLLRAAHDAAGAGAAADLRFVIRHADPELREMLDRAGMTPPEA